MIRLLALDLQRILEAAGATVVGPAREVSEAISFIKGSKVSAAVLDYRLVEFGDIRLPLARLLAERRIPFLFETSDPDSVARKHPGAIILAKPFGQDQLTTSAASAPC